MLNLYCLYLRAMQNEKPNTIYISVHILFWILITSIPILLQRKVFLQNSEFVITWTISLLESVGVFYLFYGCVIKRYFKPNKLLRFAIAVFLVLIVYIGFELVIDNLAITIFELKDTYKLIQRIVSKLFSNTFIIGVALFINLIENWLRSQKYQKAIERERLESELKMLKFQINPHFLFNTLNNLHTLVYKKSDLAPEVVMKLSSLMRYMLYETEGNSVSLTKELEYLQNFVELQKLRLASNQQVIMTIKGEANGYEIAPLLLVPFIENAFKHGTRASKETQIEILVSISDGVLTFNCINDYQPNVQSQVDSGIGLTNVKKRLELMYNGRYQLEIDTNNSKYNVNLTLSL